MSTRNIKDAKDLTTGELIYFKGHAQATFMSDGRTVEEAINSSNVGGGSGNGENVDLSNYYTKTEIDNVVGSVEENLISSINTKQDKLTSGSTIKTINGTSLLGSGNIKVGNKTLYSSTSSSMSLSPNIYYRNTNSSLSSLTITLASASDSTILNEYFVEFTTRSSGTTVYLPSTIKWANGETPSFEAGKTYQISIVNNLGICTKFA